MLPDPLGIPVRAQEASQLADLVFQFAEGRTVDDALRRMLAARSSQAPFENMRVYWGSLVADPVAKSTYYVAAEGRSPVLLHIARSTAPGSGLFPNSVLVGRMRTPWGVEVVVNAIPFAAADRDRILTYARELDRGVLPGPQGMDSLFIAASTDADTAFQQFRAVQRRYGLCVAAWVGDPAEGLWGAIRNGWRDGFPMRGDGAPASRSFIDATAIDDEGLGEKIGGVRRMHGRTLDIDVRFDPPGTFTKAGALFSRLERLRAAGRPVQVVEVEVGLRPGEPYPRTIAEMAGWPEDVLSNVQWKAGGEPLVELRQRVEALQNAARQFGALIGITGYGSTAEETLEAIGRGAARRLWFNLGVGLSPDRITDIVGLLRG